MSSDDDTRRMSEAIGQAAMQLSAGLGPVIDATKGFHAQAVAAGLPSAAADALAAEYAKTLFGLVANAIAAVKPR